VGDPIGIGPNNDVSTCYWGVYIETSSNVKIHNNSLTDNGLGGITYGGGIAITDFSNEIYIEDNHVVGNWANGIWGFNANNIYVYRNEFNGSAVVTNHSGFELVSGLDIQNNYFCQAGQNGTVAYLVTSEIVNGNFDNNVVSDNIGGGALFNIGQMNVYNSRFESNAAFGFGLQLGSYDSVIANNFIRFNNDMGMHIVGNNMNITNNLFEGNGDGDPHTGNPDWQDCGLDILNSYDIYVYKNRFIENVRDTSGHVDGIYVWGTERQTTAFLEDNQMDKNNINLHVRGGATVVDTNSTYNVSQLVLPIPSDVYLEVTTLPQPAFGPNYVTFLNTTFDKDAVVIDDPESRFEVQWYKHILVHGPREGRDPCSWCHRMGKRYFR
jgi:hypothetical protein